MTAIIIDIETLPLTASVGMDLTTAPGWTPPPSQIQQKTPPSNWVDPAKIAEYNRKAAREYAIAVAEELDANRAAAVEEYRKGVFRFSDVRIATIGFAVGDGDGDGEPVVLECPEVALEREALEELGQVLKENRGPIVTFGDYDPRIIRARLLAHGLRWGAWGIDAKPWERRVVDLQRLFAEALNGRASEIRGISVDALCAWLGIERADNPISGAGVLDAYTEGRWSDVVAHCRADVRDESALWRALSEVR